MPFATTFRSALALLTLMSLPAFAQERPPATPLIAHDPYFSVWSNTDKLNESDTRHWTGHPQPLVSLVRVDGKPYRLMGNGGRGPNAIPAMPQTALELAPTHTTYKFAGAGVAIELQFFTPAFLEDMDLLSRPVTYLRWTANATDSAQHQVEVLLDASAEIATSYTGQPVTFSRNRTATTDVISVGTRDQAVLNRSGDDLRIDWGYFHIAAPKDQNAQLTLNSRTLQNFAEGVASNGADEMVGAVASTRRTPHLAAQMSLGSVGATAVSRYLLLSYTEDYAIQLLQQNLRPYWQRNGLPVNDMLDLAAQQYDALDARGNAFDKSMTADMTTAGGAHYAWLCTLAYRQAIAAHKLVAGSEGEPLLFAKENFSNGDMATVDVLYPSAPIFLLFNPAMLRAQVLPVLRYAAMPNHWHFPFAPHDLGQYPLANGQEYGGGEKTEENQMPVEESGNLLILVDALARAQNDSTLASTFWPQLTQWADYLREHGLDPENQLTTDDFAGHVAHNSNLSIKAIEGVAAYASLARRLHRDAEAKRYGAEAKQMAQKWVGLAKEGDHYKLAYNSPGTWSQKYNLVWDKLLEYGLFPPDVATSELAYYKTKMNGYGLPLDSRADYTKLDWEIWTATLAPDMASFQAFVDPIYRWTNETVTRVPLTDWYDTKTGKQIGFQARSVVGGVFIKALSDGKVRAKYAAAARRQGGVAGTTTPASAP